MKLPRALGIEDLQRLNQAFALKERQLASELATLRETYANDAAEMAKHEQELRAELEHVQRDAARSIAELTRAQTDREGTLQSELATLRETHATDTAEMAKHEQELRAALEQVQRDAARSIAELTRAQADREGALQNELATLRETHATDTVERATREDDLRAQLEHVRRDAAGSTEELKRAQAGREGALQSELATLRETHAHENAKAAKREHDLRAQLEHVQREAARSIVELTRMQAERAGTLQGELVTRRELYANESAAAAKREQDLRAALKQAQDELVMLRKTYATETANAVTREQGLRAELEHEQREVAQSVVALSRAQAEREGALNELSAKRQQIEDASSQIDAAKKLETSLRADLAHQARRIAETLVQIEQMKHTLSWRFTAPFRKRRDLSTGEGSEAADELAAFQSGSRASISKLKSANLTSVSDQTIELHQVPVGGALHVPTLSIVNHSSGEQANMSPIQSAGKLLELDDLPFIEAVYRTLLGREPDSHGLRHYLGCLRDGYGKEKIFGEIAISSEAEVHRKELLALASGEPQPTIHQVQSVGALLELDDVPFLTASYGTLLGRVPDSEGMSHYLKCLRTGYGKENILVEIANSPEATPDVMTIQGMRELVANQKKINLPIRGIFSRTSRVERQANRLENQFGRLTSRVADLEGALENLRGMFSKEIKADDSAEPQASVTIKEHTEANAVVIHAIQRVTFAEQELTPIAARPGFEAGVIDGLKTPLEAVGRYLVRGSK